MGDHWPITEKEEKEVADANDLALSQLKGRKAKTTIRQIEAIAPWLAYAFTMFVIFGPRVQQTMKARRAARDVAPTTGPRAPDTAPEIARGVPYA